MKNLNKVSKALLLIAYCISSNLLLDKFWFKEKMDLYHVGGAIFSGITGGLILAYLFNRQKTRTVL